MTDALDLLAAMWSDLDGDPSTVGQVRVEGPDVVLPSVYAVTSFAAATVGAAALAVAELAAARTGAAPGGVTVDRQAAAASFRFEALLRPVGWDLPPIWDPVAGDYAAADGWIRLHTNYRHHLDAALTALGVAAERSAVEQAVAGWRADELEAAVVEAGGCAAAMRTEMAWDAHPAGRATAAERPVRLGAAVAAERPHLSTPDPTRPLAGVRVLDLTRVIAGPVATRYLAAYGADVLRIDPPGFDEVPALLPEATAGKRCAGLDLRGAEGRAAFVELVRGAHVLFDGLRPGALDDLGLDVAALRELNPSLVVVTHDAYGWEGPWAGRRGFDSLVQMSTGIAAAGAAAAGVDRPRPLPAQALDHGTGHLLAAGACRALTRLIATGATADVRGSLVGASNVVRSTGPSTLDEPAPDQSGAATELVDTAWGPLWRVPLAGRIEGLAPSFAVEAGPLGRHPATWTS